ncbi:MAG TPA: ABC transporter permease [Pirellulaceae bacterium]|nr:ABC transporter permease [Planctomycetaceae bacterium]HRX80410.1 ABC transporter permease [Pirellulaceae bacterium]
MSTTITSRITGPLSACLHLFGLSLRRLFRSRQTMICALLLGLASIAVVAWSMRRERSPEEFIEEIFLAVYVSFLLPIFCLSYGTAGIASDREEQTLVYLLVSPLPRPLIFLAKCSASLLLALAWTMAGMSVVCWLGGLPGMEALHVLWPAILWSTVTYLMLFMLFSVMFRRATMIALAYALFIETLIGNMPGIAKRLAVSFYTRCLIFDAGSAFGVSPSGPGGAELFVALPGPTAQAILYLLGGGLFLGGLLIFSVREYSD